MEQAEETENGMNMNVFISYARVDKHFCNHFVKQIQEAYNIWYDGRLLAGQDWWKEIYRRLIWSDVFIYLLSPDSVNSIPCQRELSIVRQLKRPIIPVVISPNTPIPKVLSKLHYVDMSNGLTAENVSELLTVLVHIERKLASSARKKKQHQVPEDESIVSESDVTVIMNAVEQALANDEYENALILLDQIDPHGAESNIQILNRMVELTEKTVEDQARVKEMKRRYHTTVSRYRRNRERTLESFEIFRKEFKVQDPPELAFHAPNGATSRSDFQEDFEPHVLEQEVLPMLQWCDIPFGVVHVSSVESGDDQFGEMTVKVDNFVMSKYLVTNAQFDIFVDVEGGYFNPRWWQFSKYALRWFESHGSPRASRFEGKDRPCENVNWYEAKAFSNWLSHIMNMNITLPNVAQWQRAAQGDDERYFPWGNNYHEHYCNTRESGLRETTPVTNYPDGASPFGPHDMAGNVWEWTLDMAEPNEESPDYRRAVVGGSFVSPYNRAQTSFRYYLDPRVRYSSIGIRLVGLT